MRRGLQFLLAFVFTLPLAAQQNPVLLDPSGVIYPPIARAAHVSGEAVVTFNIDTGSGAAVDVKPISGPLMLSYSLAERIKSWRFNLPLPINAQTDFTADCKFSLDDDAESPDNFDDDLDAPLTNFGGGYTVPQGKIICEVHNADGLTIDVSATAPPPERCPDDKEKTPPAGTTSNDTLELRRYACSSGNCQKYRVIVQRNGLVYWFGRANVVALGDRQAVLSPSDTDVLFANAGAQKFWAGCSATLPPFRAEIQKPHDPAKDDQSEDDEDGDDFSNDLLVAVIDGHTKSVFTLSPSFIDDTGIRLAWAVDKTVDTHRWRHGDPAAEPIFSNMYEDLRLPKPGITKLIRATYRFNAKGQTFAPLKAMLAHGESPNEADASGWTPLMYALQLDQPEGQEPGHEGPVQMLLSAHANPNLASLHGDTPLMISALHGTLSKLLLDHGAKINAQNADGITTLMLISQFVDPDEVGMALAAGADATATDNQGRTALDYLQAGACQRPFWGEFSGTLVPQDPCNPNSPEYKRAHALLQKAMQVHQ